MDRCVSKCCYVYGYFCNSNKGKNKVKKYLYIYKSLLQRFNYHLVSVCCFDFNKGTMVAGGVSKVVEINQNTGRLDMFE